MSMKKSKLEGGYKKIYITAKLKNPYLPMQEMQEMWAWSLGLEDPLEEEMATRSSIFIWKIPWPEKPGELQSTG